MAAKAKYYELFNSASVDTTSDPILSDPSGRGGWGLVLTGSATFVEYVIEVSIDGSTWIVVTDGGTSTLPFYSQAEGYVFNWVRFTAKNISGGDVSAVALVV